MVIQNKEIEEVVGVYECVTIVIKEALERLKQARAKLLDILSKSNIDRLGEVLGDINKAISDLEELL
jgi:exonuclease VII small subunit